MGVSKELAATPLTSDDGAVELIRVRVLPDGRMARADAARYLGLSQKTLAMWGLVGKGPRSLKIGGKVFYFRRDLDAFVAGAA